ncbi:Cellular tumor antigen p53 [Gryllus bimaculatus]|nr:Cellular tumor antigen p53 [Gryllus bimaculatus]
MSNLSRESSFLSSETLETVMGRVSSNDIDMILSSSMKLENLDGVEDCLLENITCVKDGEEVPHTMLYGQIPDTTQYVMPILPASSTGAQPSMEDYPGPHNFDVQLSKTACEKRSKWEFSSQLNKLFAVMLTKIPVKFKINSVEPGLRIRVLPIFVSQDSLGEPVKRCPTHVSHLEKSNKDFEHVEHIIRCDHQQATYEKNPQSERLSIVVPTESPQPGSDTFTVIISFIGEVVGRKMINFRICSCPRRDMSKEEESNESVQDKKSEEKNTEIISPDKKILKKRVKRLSKDSESVKIRLPKMCLKPLREIILMINGDRELTEGERECLEDINKHLSLCTNETN